MCYVSIYRLSARLVKQQGSKSSKACIPLHITLAVPCWTSFVHSSIAPPLAAERATDRQPFHRPMLKTYAIGQNRQPLQESFGRTTCRPEEMHGQSSSSVQMSKLTPDTRAFSAFLSSKATYSNSSSQSGSGNSSHGGSGLSSPSTGRLSTISLASGSCSSSSWSSSRWNASQGHSSKLRLDCLNTAKRSTLDLQHL
mgnify:CR=1 FL=1